MRLRYQMRGLGIGILVTALLMGVAKKEGRPLTDAEIRAKAYELGMVDQDSVRLTDFKDNTPGPQGTPPPQKTAEPTEPSVTAEPENTQPPQQTQPPQETTPPGETMPPESAPPAGTLTPEPASENAGEAVTVIITRGTDSYSVSVQLAEAGLIESAPAFDSYLCKNGYASKIRADIYQIVPGTSEEQIAKIITGTR